MSANIPSPPNISPTRASLDWDTIPKDSRDVMMRNWYSVGSEVEVRPVDTTQERIADFWERGWVDKMPTLTETIQDVETNPQAYSRDLFYKPKAFAAPIEPKYYYALHTEPVMREGDAIVDLGSYLDQVSAVAVQTGDDAYAEEVETFKSGLGYLSEDKFDEGAEFIAKAWVAELTSEGGKPINVYVPSRDDSPAKSNHYALSKVMEVVGKELAALSDDERVRATTRLNTNPDNWQDDGRLVILDDWVISGGSSKEYVDKAKLAAQERDITVDDGATEVHAIALSSSHDEAEGITYRAVFKQDLPEGTSYRDVSMVGAHCTVNYGAEHRIIEMQRYTAEKGVFLPAPHLFKLQPVQYRPEPVEAAAENQAALDEIARKNAGVIRVLNRLSGLNAEMSEEVDDSKFERLTYKQGLLKEVLDHEQLRRNQIRKELKIPKGI